MKKLIALTLVALTLTASLAIAVLASIGGSEVAGIGTSPSGPRGA